MIMQKALPALMWLFMLTGCTSSEDKAAQQLRQKEQEQVQHQIKKIEIACRDKYPLSVPGAFLKRKQCQQIGLDEIQIPQH
jgi:mannitol-specific phosphotransferase system IIBC component